MLNLKKYFILLLVIFIVSCAENKKIPISGADVTSDNNTDKNLVPLMTQRFQCLII